MSRSSLFDHRRAGLLLHPTSLPGSYNSGVLGLEAYRFLDFMAACGFTVWQTLPLGPTQEDLSPYSAQSVHAGNPRLISLEQLIDIGLLKKDNGPRTDEDGWNYQKRRLVEAHRSFRESGMSRVEYDEFLHHNQYWLEDYVLFQAIRTAQGYSSWVEWPRALRDRHPQEIAEVFQNSKDNIEQCRFEQFLFYQQWAAIKRYANENGILIFGDIPLFVGHDSADVWAQRHCFLLDEEGNPHVVAGVPPDYFSSTGQLWGNPHYDWESLRGDGFQWWKDRIRTQLNQFDLLRIDHFRGLESYWEIPANAQTAVIGKWRQAPGDELFRALRTEFGHLPLVAEDLGIITPAVEALRDDHGLPGMKVLHFAFGGERDNAYLPHNHVQNSVVYTGTHDNNTTLGWLEEINFETRTHISDYLGGNFDSTALIRTAFASVANLAVIPMQDILALGGEHRMNQPGVATGNWRWRFRWEQVSQGTTAWYRHLLELYGRI